MSEKKALITGLNEDLANELGASILYLYQQHKSPKDVKGMLKYDLKLEREAIEGYRQRAMQAEEAGEIGLKIKLEEILVEETGHAEQIERILKGM